MLSPGQRHMWQRIRNFIKKCWNWLFGRAESVAPSQLPTTHIDGAAPGSKPEVPSRPVIVEPELGLASSEPPQYRKWEYFFTYQERKFYELLHEELGNDFEVFAKVRMADVVMVANEPENRNQYVGQLLRKHLDFVLCDGRNLKPLLALTDDSSHNKYNRQESDEFKEQVCKQAGLPLLRVAVRQTYPKGEIRELVYSHLSNVTTDGAKPSPTSR